MSGIWQWVAAALTLIVLSRAFGNNPVFRFSQYLFVGLSLGYAATVIVTKVLVSRFGSAMQGGEPQAVALVLIPLLLGVLLLTRLGGQQASWMANVPLGLLFGVAAALTITGTFLGVLIPQILASLFSIRVFTGADLAAAIGRVVLLIGIVLVLLSFRFTRTNTKPNQAEVGSSVTVQIGRWWLLVSLGVVFAGSLVTYQTALIDRIQFLLRQVGLG